MKKFVALYDAHIGYEIDSSRHKVALHDPRAISIAMQFIKDFQPDHVVLGGDILDCGSVSHHRKGQVGQLEGLRLLAEAKECSKTVIEPLEAIVKGRLIYHIGNHEAWLDDVVDQMPALEGVVDVRSLLKLNSRWEIIPQGKASKLGKITFIHGDQVRGGEHSAKAAVMAYERNVRLGHHHTMQVHTKTAASDMNGHTGIAVPCLCKKSPRYAEGAPNRWCQGFLWGYVDGPGGMFNDYLTVIVAGKAIVNGKLYRG